MTWPRLCAIRSVGPSQGDAMATLVSFARRHPGLTYYSLVFLVSWGGILCLAGPRGIPGTPEQVATLMPIVLIALFAGPSIAGVVCTGWVHGRGGLRDLLSRGLRWRVGARGYATALLTAPLLVTATLFGLSRISSEFLPGIVIASN